MAIVTSFLVPRMRQQHRHRVLPPSLLLAPSSLLPQWDSRGGSNFQAIVAARVSQVSTPSRLTRYIGNTFALCPAAHPRTVRVQQDPTDDSDSGGALAGGETLPTYVARAPTDSNAGQTPTFVVPRAFGCCCNSGIWMRAAR
ncbi:hypothetical protein B0H13DRAFT_1876387 [Mycena leptocephala]|nr:hypothetical protein B0H13DRAFT_1876387 [Mycena leptocephala]